MAPKSKTNKTFYVLPSDAFNLKHWNGVVRLNESPPLTYWWQDHLSKGARTRSVSFLKFSFSSFSSILHFNMFLDMLMLGFDMGYVLVKVCLMMSKNDPLSIFMCIWLAFMCVRPGFMHTWICSCVHVSVLEFTHRVVSFKQIIHLLSKRSTSAILV